MGKRLNMAEVRIRAEAEKVSPFLVVKRMLDYGPRDEAGSRCRECVHAGAVTLGERRGMQCEVVGVSDDPECWVEGDHGCASAESGPPMRW